MQSRWVLEFGCVLTSGALLAPAAADARQSEVDKIRAEWRQDHLRQLERGDAKAQIEAAGRLDGDDADKVVPVLARHLAAADANIRLSAANTFWTLISRKAEAWEAARPSLMAALDDTDGAVAMYAAGALAGLKTPPEVLVPARKRVLEAGHPRVYVRFLAARGLIGIEPPAKLVAPLLDYLDETAAARKRGGSRENLQLAERALERLVATQDRGLIDAMAQRLPPGGVRPNPSTVSLVKLMHQFKQRPTNWTQTLLAFTDTADRELAETAWRLVGAQLDEPSLALWTPVAAPLLGDDIGRDLVLPAFAEAAGRASIGLAELAALANNTKASEAHRLRAIEILGRSADAENRQQITRSREMARDLYLKVCEPVWLRPKKDAWFDACLRPLSFAVRDQKARAAMLGQWLTANTDTEAKLEYLQQLEGLWSDAFAVTDNVRAHLNHPDARVKTAAEKALDRIRPAWRESAAREAKKSAPTAAAPAGKPAAATAPADGAALYAAIRIGDLAQVKKLVNAGNVRLPIRFAAMQGNLPAPLNVAINYCGIPTVTAEQLAAIVTYLISVGAEPDDKDASGDNLFDRAKAACPPEVMKALGG